MIPVRIYTAGGWMEELLIVLFGDIASLCVSAEFYREITDHIQKAVSFPCVGIVEYENLVVLIDGNDSAQWVCRRGLRSLGKPFIYLKLQYHHSVKAPFKVTPFTYVVPKMRVFDDMLPKLRQRYIDTPKDLPAWGRFIAVSLSRHNVAKKMRECGITAGGQYCLSPAGYEESNLDHDMPRQRMPFERYLDYFMRSSAAIDAMGFGDFTHRMIEAMGIGVPLIRPALTNTTYDPLIAGYHYLDCGQSGETLQSCISLLNHNPDLREQIAKRALDWYDHNASPAGIRSLYNRILAETSPNPAIPANQFEPFDHFYERLPGWFDFDDIYTEMVEKAQDGARFVEVGCWKGRSTAFLGIAILNSCKKISLDCVDTWRGSPEHGTDSDLARLNGNILKVFVDNTMEINGVINCIQKLSVEAARLYDDRSLDFVFIDADHAFEAVSSDIKAWLPKVKKGGVLAGHDINWASVKAAVDANLGTTGYTVSRASWIHRVL